MLFNFWNLDVVDSMVSKSASFKIETIHASTFEPMCLGILGFFKDFLNMICLVLTTCKEKGHPWVLCVSRPCLWTLSEWTLLNVQYNQRNQWLKFLYNTCWVGSLHLASPLVRLLNHAGRVNFILHCRRTSVKTGKRCCQFMKLNAALPEVKAESQKLWALWGGQSFVC